MAVSADEAAPPSDDLEQALRDIDPVELRATVLRRAAATGFVTKDVLKRLYARLMRERVDATSLLVDLGCGRAGASLLLAEKMGARLHGIDCDAVAIDEARAWSKGFSLEREPQFDCASFDATWIEPASAHAVISIDALHLAPSQLDVLAEVHRILINRGILAFNVYVSETDPDASSWVQALETAGFTTIDIDDQTDGWRELMTARHRARIAHASFLTRRFGIRVAPELAQSRALLGLDFGPSVIASTRRVELVARKLPSNAPPRRRRFAHGSVQTMLHEVPDETGD